MFTQEQIKILQDFGFTKVNLTAYKYQNLIIFALNNTFIITYAGDRTLTRKDYNTFDDALKFIEEFGFLLFTKKEVEVLTELGFVHKEDNKYIKITVKYRIIVFCYEDSYAVSWISDKWKSSEDFDTFAETAAFLKTLN